MLHCYKINKENNKKLNIFCTPSTSYCCKLILYNIAYILLNECGTNQCLKQSWDKKIHLRFWKPQIMDFLSLQKAASNLLSFFKDV